MQKSASLTLASLLLASAHAAQGLDSTGGLQNRERAGKSGRDLLFYFGSSGRSSSFFNYWIPPTPVDIDGNEGDEGDEGGFSSSGSQSFGSSATCSISAKAVSFTESVDAHVGALATAFNLACDAGFDGTLDAIKDEYLEQAGYATAQAIADSSLECTSSGQAIACARAEAQARAWAAATASSNARAAASAMGSCGTCLANDTAIEAAAEAFSEDIAELVAEAYAVSSTYACVAGDQTATAQGFMHCFADAYALVFARATVYSLTQADCVSEEVALRIRAANKIDVSTMISCDPLDGATGPGDVSVGGDASATAE